MGDNPVNLRDPSGQYALQGFPPPEAQQMWVAVRQLYARLKQNPCCIDPKLRDRVLQLIHPGENGSGVKFVYKHVIPNSDPHKVTCAQVADDWAFMTSRIEIAAGAMNGVCRCPLPGTILHEAVHLTWKNEFQVHTGQDFEQQPYAEAAKCFGPACAK